MTDTRTAALPVLDVDADGEASIPTRTESDSLGSLQVLSLIHI